MASYLSQFYLNNLYQKFSFFKAYSHRELNSKIYMLPSFYLYLCSVFPSSVIMDTAGVVS